jgi:hypothetical protein
MQTLYEPAVTETDRPDPGRRGSVLRRLGSSRIVQRFRLAPVEPEEYVPGVTRLRPLLMRPAILGAAAVIAILIGASQPTSPFTLTSVPGSWWWGIPGPAAVTGTTAPPGQNLFVGVVLVYAGMILLMRAWYGVYRVTLRYPDMPVRKLVPIVVAWMVPLLVVAPLFSRDVYSYAAQGEMMSHGISPYAYGPQILGPNNWVAPVDQLWQNVTSPYGPVFLALSGYIVTAAGHSELFSVLGLRFLAVAGVVLIGIYLPRLAESYGFKRSPAFVLGVLNPLTLLHLVAGAHNDALMLGLLIAGLTYAREKRPIVGILLVAVATAVKVPAALGLVYIGWEWLGDSASLRARIRPVLTALIVGAATMVLVSWAVGLGFGWISALTNPGSVKSYMDPPTAIGLFAGDILHALGLGGAGGALTAVRGIGLLAACAIGLKLLLQSDSRTSLRALGLTFIAVTMLGPVLQPWYLAWSVVILAAVAEGRTRTLVIVVSCVAAFLGLPGGFALIDELEIASPVLLALGSLALGLVLVALLVPRFRHAIKSFRADLRERRVALRNPEPVSSE